MSPTARDLLGTGSLELGTEVPAAVSAVARVGTQGPSKPQRGGSHGGVGTAVAVELLGPEERLLTTRKATIGFSVLQNSGCVDSK